MFRRNFLSSLRSHRVVVYFKSGRVVRGFLTGVYDDSLVLAHAAAVFESGEEPMEGRLAIPRDQIELVNYDLPWGAVE